MRLSMPRPLVSHPRLPAVLALALLPFGAGALAGQAGRSGIGEPQTVTIDFTVVARDGRPVTDLKADEITLRIDGRPRPLASLDYVRFAAAGDPATAMSRPAPAFATNAPPESVRSIVLVVDDESMPIGQEHRLRAAIGDFLLEVPPNDRLALVTVPHGGVKVDLTTDRDRLRRGVAEIMPISPVVHPSCRARSTLLALRTVFETLSRTGTQPIVVVFFASNMTGPSPMERVQAPSATTGGGGLSTAGGACNLQADDFKLVGAAAAEARVQLFVMHPDFNPTPVGVGIENLRGVTSAPLLHLSGTGGESGLARMARETAGYYLATFSSEAGERLGVSHQLSVRTTRRDVDVRARPSLIVGSAQPAVGPAPTFTSAFELLRSGRTFREVPLRATAFSTRGAGKLVNLVSLFEPADARLKIASAAAALFDAEGRGVAYWTSDGADLATTPIVVGMNAPPGRYRLRIGAIDATGRYGVVEDVVVAELSPAGPLSLSGLALGLSRPGGFRPWLLFSTEASALAHVELYGGTAGMPISAVFEVARTTDGPALFRVPGALAATGEDDRFTATGTITVGMLPPGIYVIRAIVGVEGRPAGRVVRTLQKLG